jgi:hypothetical protein
MIYIDIALRREFGWNFQPFMRRRDAKDGSDDDYTREPEMVKAYRDTWELGLHQYLTYLRDRLLAARELLAPSGNVFVLLVLARRLGTEHVETDAAGTVVSHPARFFTSLVSLRLSRSQVTWTASSASASEPSMRTASARSRTRCAVKLSANQFCSRDRSRLTRVDRHIYDGQTMQGVTWVQAIVPVASSRGHDTKDGRARVEVPVVLGAAPTPRRPSAPRPTLQNQLRRDGRAPRAARLANRRTGSGRRSGRMRGCTLSGRQGCARGARSTGRPNREG